MMEKADISIKGLHCVDCVTKVERGLSSSPGVLDVNLNFTSGKLHVEYDSSQITLNGIHARIRSLGHEVLDEEMEGVGSVFTLKNRVFVFTVISGCALFAGLLLEHALDRFVTDPAIMGSDAFHDIRLSGFLSIAAMVFGGFHISRSAISGLRNKVFVIDSLMITGAVGAVLLGELAEGGAVLFLFSLAGLLENYSVDRSRRSLRELVGLKPGSVVVKREGELREVLVEEVRIGDVAVVRPGERIGVDGIVSDGCSSVNQAPITGESMPVEKDSGHRVFAGTMNLDGRLEIRVDKDATDSALARIIQMVESAEEHKAETERFVDRFSKYFTPSVIVMAVFVATVPALLLDQPFEDWFYKALLLLIISCPCALALSTPISIVSGITTGAKHGILFKGGVYLEKLEEIDTFAFDKTGTLTEGRPSVTDVIPLNGHSREEVLSMAASLESLSKHPLGTAIVSTAGEERVKLEPVTDLKEIPGKGIEGTVHGEQIIVGSSRLFDKESLRISGDGESGVDVLSRLEDQAKTAVIVGGPEKIMGVIGISDRIRVEAREMVKDLREQGIGRIVMITGDNERTAHAVAREIGIREYHAELLPGEKVELIERLKGIRGSDEEGSEMGGKPAGDLNLKTRVKISLRKRLKISLRKRLKIRLLMNKKTQGGVAMVGDGVNDAPALVTADLGIAMGVAGSDTAMEVADIALMDEDLSRLPELLSLGRRTMSVIRQNIVLAIGVKLVFAILVFPGLVTLWMAVAIGDMGVSLAVIANALRLTRSENGGEGNLGIDGRSSGKTKEKGGSVKGADDHGMCDASASGSISACSEGCCGGDGRKDGGTGTEDGESVPMKDSGCDDDCCH